MSGAADRRLVRLEVYCDVPAQDAVSSMLIDHGSPGTEIRSDAQPVVIGWLPVNRDLTPRLRKLHNRLEQLPQFGLCGEAPRMVAVNQPETDWPRRWREYHAIRRVGRRCVITPPWEHPETNPGDCVITLDPGMAFGTGSHATTQLALESLELAMFDGARVADVGTGTGILAIAAGLLGASSVLATDIDLLPREVAAHNVALHALQSTVRILEPAEFWGSAKNCDIIVVNIVSNVILPLATSIAEAVVPGGAVILSGVVEEHVPLMCRALADIGLVSPVVTRRDVWAALTLVADPSARHDTGALAAAQLDLPPVGSPV